MTMRSELKRKRRAWWGLYGLVMVSFPVLAFLRVSPLWGIVAFGALFIWQIYAIRCANCRAYFDLNFRVGGWISPLAKFCPYCGIGLDDRDEA